MTRRRVRDLGIVLGHLPPGPNNAITDVPGVRVGHATVISDLPAVVRTGVTMIVPRDEIWNNPVFGAAHIFNGNGEMTGLPWVAESGLVTTPIGVTNTNQVGLVRDTLIAIAMEQGWQADFLLPIVAETWDGWLSAIHTFPVTAAHVRAALLAAREGAVAEGNVGGGTGMICHSFKGGIGTASRVVVIHGTPYTVGVLVQANYGTRPQLMIGGVPVGRIIDAAHTPLAKPAPQPDGSIIVVIACDAPLLPTQCQRLAQRATVGLARAGGVGFNSSGDLFLAFATGNTVRQAPHPIALTMLPHAWMDPLFAATAESVEEAIINALTMAETMVGQDGRIAHAIPLDALAALVADGRWAAPRRLP